jgi:rod shape-determining protein MreC
VPPYAGPPVASRSGDAASPLRLLAYLALAITLIVLDDQAGWLAHLRGQANSLVQPVWALAGLPGKLGNQVKDSAASHGQLVNENRELRNQLLLANARLTRLQTAALDNAQLRELLNVAERSGLDVQLAPILDIDLDPVKQRLVLDAGSREGVHVGQAVIDAGGLMGQVISVTGGTSTVLLLTDPDHAVPVTVARNGVRLIVYGRGDKLELRDIPLSAGVEVGDEIVTSGLGGRFPAGFPVGTITGLRPDDTHAFLVGELKPAAQLDRGRDVLLLRPGAAIRIPPNLRLQMEQSAPGGPADATALPTGTAPAATQPSPVVPAAGRQQPSSQTRTVAPASSLTPAPSARPLNKRGALPQLDPRECRPLAGNRPRRRPSDEPPARQPVGAAGQPGGGAAAGPAAVAGAAAATAPVLAGAGAGVLGDRDTRAGRPGHRFRQRRHRRPAVRRRARRTGAAAGDAGLHPAAFPRPHPLLPDVAADAGHRRPAVQRSHRQRPGAHPGG